ncbi:MAG: signal recognition particle-docking protein FtsY [Myxococcales bacterium]|nr:signal recognition particle-docking protein FtsY [Myxococcales bacterium]|tara:strand:- start:2639 stop:3871 length:1233 start_codon:yes stop_codon:yes gene_type:complete
MDSLPFHMPPIAAAESSTSATELVVLVAVLGALVLFGVLILRKVWAKKEQGYDDKAPEQRPTEAKPTAKPKKAERGIRQHRQWERPPEPVVEEPEEEPAVISQPATIQQGLARTRSEGFVARLRRTLNKELRPEVLDEIEEVLLTSDIGVKTANMLLAQVREQLTRSELKDGEAVLGALRQEAQKLLHGVEREASADTQPKVILVLGVNGAGKTTTLGKLAHRAQQEGKRIMLVAGDTFRAAAVDQLRVWAERSKVDFHAGKADADPASVIFDGIKRAKEEGHDLVLCDTAGRLHTNQNLVDELKKVVRVAGKAHDGCPHETVLVLDATIGQNAVHQARTFTDALGVDSIVLTKLDGTARGGVVLGIVDQLKVPIRDVGVGEGVEDLRPFNSDEFLDGLFAQDESNSTHA